jgi:long-subunit fatty acid transport protein
MIRNIYTAVAAGLILALASAASSAGEPGTAGFLFLRLGDGARASGMGEAYTAVADDATSIYWNPAGMASVQGVALNLTHSEWFQGVRLEQVSVVNEMFSGAAGLQFTGVYYGSLDRYGETPTLVPDGTFSPYDLSFAAGYAMDILPNVAVGAAIKGIYSKIDFESAGDWAVDLGILHRSQIKGLTLGASVLNWGPQAKFVADKFFPPFQIRGGAAYRYDASWLRGHAILAADAVFPNDGTGKVHFGMEYSYREMVAIRAGYKTNYDTQGATVGLGVNWRGFSFDYAYMPMDFNLGDAHRFSLNVSTPAL